MTPLKGAIQVARLHIHRVNVRVVEQDVQLWLFPANKSEWGQRLECVNKTNLKNDCADALIAERSARSRG
jgi:hypothetical protein